MIKRNWIVLLAAACWLLPGCLRNDKDVETGPSTGEDTSAGGYVAFFLDEEESRSDIHKDYDDSYAHYEWFNRGTKNERTIADAPEANRVLFFNADNSYYGEAKLAKTPTENVYLGEKPVGGAATAPTQFLIVVNGDPDRLDALNAELAAAGTDALKLCLNWLQELDDENPESTAMYKGEYFTMSSSIYQTEEDHWLDGVTVKENFQFYETREEALLPENLLRFHVDRVLAKVTVRIQDGELTFGNNDVMILRGATTVKIREFYSIEDGTTDKDVMSGWSANIASWGINGIEKNTFLFKRLVETPDSYPWQIPSDFYPRWSEYRLYRSYWAVDENYSTGFYPYQYRVALGEESPVKSATTNTIYSEDYDPSVGFAKDDYTLIYRSYNAFGTRSDHKYSVENTYDECVLADEDYATKPWLRCGSHVIVAAQLIVDALDKDVDLKKVDENGFIAGVSDKYFSNGLYWSKEALMQQAVSTLVSNLTYNDPLDGIRNVLGEGNLEEFIDNDENNPLAATPLVDSEGTVISAENAEEYFELAPAFIKGGDGWVTIHLKEGKVLKALHEDGTMADISEEQLVSYIYRFTNLARHFNEGRMYYALPLKHNVDSKNFEKGYEKVSTGDYGMVRNHWYRLTINEALLPGTPVDDPDQPIIPNPEPDDKSLGVDIEIIPWHIVDIHVPNLQ